MSRGFCRRCRKDDRTCYCARVRPFAPEPLFVILIHPKENRKRVGTGRLTHLCLSNSLLIQGIDFTRDEQVAAILSDEANWPVVLYPGPSALDISRDARGKMAAVRPPGKRLVIFVIDASWFLAKKMLRVSANLKTLPQLCFVPPRKSAYRIRRQPKDICFSTVEAVHFMIDQLDGQSGHHENLLEVFQYMIDQQLSHVRTPRQRATRGKRTAAVAPSSAS